jgi:hypothetical protein
MAMNKIVSGEEWLEAPKALLKKEKEFTSLRDKLSQQRRDLPSVSVNKEDLLNSGFAAMMNMPRNFAAEKVMTNSTINHVITYLFRNYVSFLSLQMN